MAVVYVTARVNNNQKPNRLNYLNLCRKRKGEDADRNRQKKFDIQIIRFYKGIDDLVLVTCRLQVKLRPTAKEFRV